MTSSRRLIGGCVGCPSQGQVRISDFAEDDQRGIKDGCANLCRRATATSYFSLRHFLTPEPFQSVALARSVPQSACPLSAHEPTHAARDAVLTRPSKRLVDDLTGSHQHCWWYCQIMCFQRLLLNDETKAGWLLEWQIGGARYNSYKCDNQPPPSHVGRCRMPKVP